MDYRVHFTKRSLEDLADILGYIAEENSEAAAHLGNTLLDHIELLTRFPEMGERVRERSRVRKLVHTPVVVYYQVLGPRRIIQVVHVRHAARRPPQL